ncbi:hypothetical protein [Cupriavidus taiwanensis]|uniref:hypothetical protein n=1 Tax=Cupriavidus taiwanensis TaxID=164546 RepID=UPI0039C4AC0F
MAKVATRERVITAADSCLECAARELVEDGWTAALSPISKQGTSTREAGELQYPNAKAGLEDASPKNQIASILGHEAEKVRLFGEDDELVDEVPA